MTDILAYVRQELIADPTLAYVVCLSTGAIAGIFALALTRLFTSRSERRAQDRTSRKNEALRTRGA